MERYDFTFSLGFGCGVTQSLRAAGLQFASYPLDWTAAPSVGASARLVAAGFDRWLEPEDLRLVDVRHGVGFCTRIYKNVRTGFGFTHEFSDFERFKTSYPKVKAMYERRIGRFLGRMRAARRILAVYAELPIRPRPPVAELEAARKVLKDAFPQAEIDLVCFFVEPGQREPAVAKPLDGLTVVGLDYRKFDDGKVTHFIETDKMTSWLRRNFSVSVQPDREDPSRHGKHSVCSDAWRWGKEKSWLRRWINKNVYKLYRHLEMVLLKRGMVHREGPLWFVDVQGQEGER